jgi:hypothetical protein
MNLGPHYQQYADALYEFRRTRRKKPPPEFMASGLVPERQREACWLVHRDLARDHLIMVKRAIAAGPR